MGWDRHEINELLASPNIGSYHPPGQIRLCSSSRLVSFFAVPGPLVLATPCVPHKVLWDCGLCALVGQPVAEPAGLLCTHQSGGMWSGVEKVPRCNITAEQPNDAAQRRTGNNVKQPNGAAQWV